MIVNDLKPIATNLITMVYLGSCEFCGRRNINPPSSDFFFVCLQGRTIVSCINENCKVSYSNAVAQHELKTQTFSQYENFFKKLLLLVLLIILLQLLILFLSSRFNTFSFLDAKDACKEVNLENHIFGSLLDFINKSLLPK